MYRLYLAETNKIN